MKFYGNGEEFALIEDALHAAGMAWWLMELPTGAIFFSVNKIIMLGYTEKDLTSFVHYKNFTDLVHPDDYETCMQAMRELLEGRTDTYETTYRIKALDGSYKTYFDRGKIAGRKGSDLAVVGITTNMSLQLKGPTPTERKK